MNLKRLLLISFAFLMTSSSYAQTNISELKMSLKEVSELSLTNNFEIQLAKYDAWIAQTDRIAAESIYDLMFFGEGSYSRDRKKRTTTLLGTDSRENIYSVGLEQKLPTGTTLTVEQKNIRTSTDSSFATNSVTHDSSLGVTLEQSLGRNFFGIEDRNEVKITRLDVLNAEHGAIKSIEESLADVQKTYWGLVFAGEVVMIEKGMLDQAKRLYDLHQEKLEDGLVEKPEALNSEANYKERLNELVLAENELRTQSNLLRLKLNLEDDNVIIIPTEHLEVNGGELKIEDSLKKAIKNREDYKQKLNDVKKRKLELSVKKTSLWPEIDLTATYEQNGLGGDFPEAVGDISSQENPDIFVGATVSVPLQNREARSNLKKAKLLDARTLIELKKIERTIATEVINAVKNVNVLREVADNSRYIAQIQNEKFLEEQNRFYRGRSDTDTLIRFQEDSLQAQRRSALASNQYLSALIDLQVIEGSLLNKYWQGEL